MVRSRSIIAQSPAFPLRSQYNLLLGINKRVVHMNRNFPTTCPPREEIVTKMSADLPVVVVGAGLAGSMMALMLAKRGIAVELYELRPDYRIEEREVMEKERHLGQSKDPTKRSINLALSHRGFEGLRAVGLDEKVREQCIRMPCRAIHSLDGAVTTQPYGRPGQAIYSASRSLLNTSLLDECERYSSLLKIFFEHKMESLSADGTVVFQNLRDRTTRTVHAKLVVGSDGAYSAVRNSMLKLNRMDFARTYLKHGYKELNMPPTASGEFAMPVTEALHIWPRHDFMMIALPNPDKTFTCTLFLPWEQLDELDADVVKARKFFETHFPDTLPLITDFEKQFQTHPSSALVMINADPWSFKDKAVLIGDAAHSVTPFYGQGANCAFEDCLFFTECLDACHGDVSQATVMFARERKPAGDALSRLSLDNYVEMRHKTATTMYKVRKGLDGVLNSVFGDGWLPLYSMVSFTRIPYNEAYDRARKQDAILNCAVATSAVAVLAAGVYAFTKYGGPAYVERLLRKA